MKSESAIIAASEFRYVIGGAMNPEVLQYRRCMTSKDRMSRIRTAAVFACGLTVGMGLANAQGIYPGDTAAGRYTLPYGFEPVVQLRTYYFDAESQTNTQSEAWALGGWAGLRSPWFGDVFQFGIVGYTSQPLYAPAGKGGTKILKNDQQAINVLGEAFGAVRIAGQTFAGYRQLIDRPFLGPQDSRMVPNTFEAYTLSGTIDSLTYTGGYVTKMKVRQSEDFLWMSNVAGGTGDQQGVAFAGATLTFGKSSYVKIDDQYSTDVFNNFYIEGSYLISYDDKTSFTLGAQYFPQTSVGAAQIGTFSTYGVGLQAAVNRGPFVLQVMWTQTGKGFATQNPYGEHMSYVDMMQIKFNTAGERAWGIGANVDFTDFGVPGLTAAAAYGSGRNAINYATGAPIADENETDIRVDYAIAKASPLAGLIATFRYSWWRQEGYPTATELRAILNYAVTF
jgi:outer membrane porin, OprD family